MVARDAAADADPGRGGNLDFLQDEVPREILP